VTDRVVQAALKLVPEAIFEADFQPCSYGFRPGRRAQDAIAEVHYLTTRTYEWVVEADIEACFDQIDPMALMDRVRDRIKDKRVLALVKAFLHAGILTEQGGFERSVTGTPQGGILSPLLANIALSALDEHFAHAWRQMGANAGQRGTHRRRGNATYRLVRYADDFVIVVSGERRHAEALVVETGQVLAPLGLTLSQEKTRIPHRRGDRVPRLPHPAPAGATRPPLRLHLPVEAVACGGHAKDQGDHAGGSRSDARPAAAQAQPGAPRLARLLSPRDLQADV
jgi:RNA-directed DNA polymerase